MVCDIKVSCRRCRVIADAGFEDEQAKPLRPGYPHGFEKVLGTKGGRLPACREKLLVRVSQQCSLLPTSMRHEKMVDGRT